MKLRNKSTRDLEYFADAPELGIVPAGSVFEVPDEVGKRLLEQSDVYELAKGAKESLAPGNGN